MATFTCDVNQLLTLSACYQKYCLADQQWLAIEIFAKIKNLAASGGTDYSANFNQLLQDAKVFQVLSADQRRAINVYVDLQNAINEGAVINTNPSALMASVAALGIPAMGLESKKNLIEFLKCSINTLVKPD